MKLILKILCAPLMALLWLLSGLCRLLLKLSSVVLMAAALLTGCAALLHLLDGHWLPGLAGLLIAFLLSPWGLSKGAARLLALLSVLRLRLRDRINR